MKERVQINQRQTISASEIGEFAYCAKSWYLKRCGELAQSPYLETGVAFHKTHEARVSQGLLLSRVGKKLGGVALILLVAIAFVWFVVEVLR